MTKSEVQKSFNDCSKSATPISVEMYEAYRIPRPTYMGQFLLCNRLHGPTMVSSSSKVGASIHQKCLYLDSSLKCNSLYQSVINSKPGSTPNPFPCPFIAIFSLSALLHNQDGHYCTESTNNGLIIYFAQSSGFVPIRAMYENNETAFCHLLCDKSCTWRSSRHLATFVVQQKLPHVC